MVEVPLDGRDLLLRGFPVVESGLHQIAFFRFSICTGARRNPATHGANHGNCQRRSTPPRRAGAGPTSIGSTTGSRTSTKSQFLESLSTVSDKYHKMAPRTYISLKRYPGITLEGPCVVDRDAGEGWTSSQCDSEAGSYFRRTECVFCLILGLRVIEKEKRRTLARASIFSKHMAGVPQAVFSVDSGAK